MKIKITYTAGLLLAVLFSFNTAFAQQHFGYGQYMHNMGPFNPSWYLSDASEGSVNAIVRKQWVGMDGAPSTMVLNGHLPFHSMNAATGMHLAYDSFGPEKLFNLVSFFAKSVRLSENETYLSAYLSAGISRYEALYSSMDGSDPHFRDDILETSGILGLGIMYYRPERFFLGFSVPQFSFRELGIGSKRADYHFNTPFYFMAGYLADLGDSFKLKPVVMGTEVKGLPTALDVSATLYIQDALGLGLSYGTSKEMGAQLSFIASSNLQLGYSYQFGTESYGISNKGNNTHEIGLGYRFGKGLTKKLL
jgi:type IX secretion system PorP/SprF family membrane protein